MAHVQQEEGALAAWLHGIVHALEGDLNNAWYWYRKADRAFPGRDTVQGEIAADRSGPGDPMKIQTLEASVSELRERFTDLELRLQRLETGR